MNCSCSQLPFDVDNVLYFEIFKCSMFCSIWLMLYIKGGGGGALNFLTNFCKILEGSTRWNSDVFALILIWNSSIWPFVQIVAVSGLKLSATNCSWIIETEWSWNIWLWVWQHFWTTLVFLLHKQVVLGE